MMGQLTLDEHVDAYVTQMGLFTLDDEVLCHVFPTSLKGATLSWFACFSLFSIDCFET